jgi:DNA modification methylase
VAVKAQVVTDRYAIYNGNCISGMSEMPSESVHLSIYSPPFRGLYSYSSSEEDLSNCRDDKDFFEHYTFVVRELERVTLPGRLSLVHCTDIPRNGANLGGGLMDFPGEIIRLHERLGFYYDGRYHVWKEPLGVRNRTMAKGLAHKQIVEDSTLCNVASADYLLRFVKRGTNQIPVAHPIGLTDYAGEREVPQELLRYRGWSGKQTENRYSHWIWRQYASSFWDDVRIDRVLPYKESKDPEDERHVHPLQLDVIERGIVLCSNPGEVVASPFMGVGSEVFEAVELERRGIGWELKTSYFNQAVKNMALAGVKPDSHQPSIFDALPSAPESDDSMEADGAE